MDEIAEALVALKRMLMVSEGTFSLSFALCDEEKQQDKIIGELCREFDNIEVVSVILPQYSIDIYGAVELAVINKNRKALFVIGFEKYIFRDNRWQGPIKSLNGSRELWEKEYLCPVVFWLTDYNELAIFKDHGPDFYRYRSHCFSFNESTDQ